MCPSPSLTTLSSSQHSNANEYTNNNNNNNNNSLSSNSDIVAASTNTSHNTVTMATVNSAFPISTPTPQIQPNHDKSMIEEVK